MPSSWHNTSTIRHQADSLKQDVSNTSHDSRIHESLQQEMMEDFNISSHNRNSSQFETSSREGHMQHHLRLPPSTTRQGTEYGMKGRLFGSGGKITKKSEFDKDRRRTIAYGRSKYEQNEIAEIETTAYKEYEKQLEYSGAPSPLKEGSIDHLYGKFVIRSQDQFPPTFNWKGYYIVRYCQCFA